ncbi:MAG: outer membrane beta-barrel protein [Bradymonadaceae bacterium]
MGRTTKISLATAVVFIVTAFAASNAFALDGYQSRKHVFGGLKAGGGVGFVNRTGELSEEGPGLHLSGTLGGGISDRLLMGVEADWWSRTVDKSPNNKYGMYHSSVGGIANFFLIGGLHIDGGLGFAYGVFDGTIRAKEREWQELGLQAEAGVGYEFWFNGTLAGGADLSYTHHFYSKSAFDTATLSFGLRWY